MPIKLTFETVLERAMERAGLNISQLAIKAGVSYNTIWKALEKGQVPRRGTRWIIANALNQDRDYFEGCDLKIKKKEKCS